LLRWALQALPLVNVDLRHVTFIDRPAIGGLVARLRAAEEAAALSRSIGHKGPVHRVLDIAGVLPVLRASG